MKLGLLVAVHLISCGFLTLDTVVHVCCYLPQPSPHRSFELRILVDSLSLQTGQHTTNDEHKSSIYSHYYFYCNEKLNYELNRIHLGIKRAKFFKITFSNINKQLGSYYTILANTHTDRQDPVIHVTIDRL